MRTIRPPPAAAEHQPPAPERRPNTTHVTSGTTLTCHQLWSNTTVTGPPSPAAAVATHQRLAPLTVTSLRPPPDKAKGTCASPCACT